MYERKGLGWSEPGGWDAVSVAAQCNLRGPSGKPREICFDTTPEDEAIAHQSGCTRLEGLLQPGTYTTCNGDRGNFWCCPDNYPRDYMENIPSDVSSYERERLRLLAQDPSTATPGSPAPDAQDQRDPRPGHRHTFWTRLTHPGAIAAMVAIAGGGTLFYFLKRRRGQR